MTRTPTKTMLISEIPEAAPGAARFIVAATRTGGYNIFLNKSDGFSRIVDHKPSEQSAIRAAIRWQKRENHMVLKPRKGNLDV